MGHSPNILIRTCTQHKPSLTSSRLFCFGRSLWTAVCVTHTIHLNAEWPHRKRSEATLVRGHLLDGADPAFWKGLCYVSWKIFSDWSLLNLNQQLVVYHLSQVVFKSVFSSKCFHNCPHRQRWKLAFFGLFRVGPPLIWRKSRSCPISLSVRFIPCSSVLTRGYWSAFHEML